MKKNLLAGALVALCLFGMLALPVSAAPTTNPATTAKISTVDQGLKDELWSSHMQYRLARYDLNVQQAAAVITILGKYGIDTSAAQATLDTVKGERAALQAALESKDRTQLKTINEELKTLWKQFRKDIRDAVRSRYGKGAADRSGIASADSPGLESE